MGRWTRVFLRNCWIGLVYSTLALIGSALYTSLSGPLFGQMNAASVALMALVFGVLALVGIVAFFRQPDPYSRSYYRYELMDVPEQLRGKLDTGPVNWLWHAAPMVLVGVILLPFFA